MSKTTRQVVVASVLVVALLAIGIAGVFYFACRFRTTMDVRSGPAAKRTVQSEKVSLAAGREDAVVVELSLDEKGEILIKAGDRTFGTVKDDSGKEVPDFDSLEDYLLRKKSEFRSSEEGSSLRVVVRAGEGINLKYAIEIARRCVKIEIDDVSFEAEPGPIDHLLNEQKGRQKPPQNK